MAGEGEARSRVAAYRPPTQSLHTGPPVAYAVASDHLPPAHCWHAVLDASRYQPVMHAVHVLAVVT